MSNEKPLPISFGIFGKKEGDKKRTQANSYPFISYLSFLRKSTLKKQTLTDEFPKVILLSETSLVSLKGQRQM